MQDRLAKQVFIIFHGRRGAAKRIMSVIDIIWTYHQTKVAKTETVRQGFTVLLVGHCKCFPHSSVKRYRNVTFPVLTFLCRCS